MLTRRRSYGVHTFPWLGRRINVGLYEMLIDTRTKIEDKSKYKKLLHMTPKDFDEILRLIHDCTNGSNLEMEPKYLTKRVQLKPNISRTKNDKRVLYKKHSNHECL